MSDEPTGQERCDFCRQPCPREPVETAVDGVTYTFCSAACRSAMEDSDRVFTEYHGYQRLHTGVAGFDAVLPQGMPRNSFVLVAGQAGTRDAAVHAELVWRTLQRGEPAVVVSFQEPPTSVVETFLTMDWNVLPYLESGQLHVLDCFTYRLSNRDRVEERMNDWNQFLRGVVGPATTAVRDPSDTGELENKLDNCLESRDMVDEGVVVMDSLTELGTMLQPVQAYDFVKNVRADVCKGRFVPVFAGATYGSEGDSFPHDLDYIVDGVVDMELNTEVVGDTLIKRVRFRKMSGVLVVPEWTAYEYTSGKGMVTFDPAEEIEKAKRARGDRDGAEEDGEGDEEADAGEGDDQAGDDETGDAPDPTDEADPADTDDEAASDDPADAPDGPGADDASDAETDGDATR